MSPGSEKTTVKSMFAKNIKRMSGDLGDLPDYRMIQAWKYPTRAEFRSDPPILNRPLGRNQRELHSLKSGRMNCIPPGTALAAGFRILRAVSYTASQHALPGRTPCRRGIEQLKIAMVNSRNRLYPGLLCHRRLGSGPRKPGGGLLQTVLDIR